ncbi:hypothetical protein OQA88_8790 [Cercophora sp. LCS_1]
MADSNQHPKTNKEVAAEFSAYYLQRATKEFAEDLDKVRTADDFRNDAIHVLVDALQQGTAMFSPEEQRRIVETKSTGKPHYKGVRAELEKRKERCKKKGVDPKEHFSFTLEGELLYY